ncbi:MAG: flagellar hook-basal body complex protein [Clostridiales bacterium]|jgi:flagellar basal-body rod protein FlgG|nr:flagellar hook-basal body complex protein [Eubacteriales bacterium]MDH7567022.1 flagellar hook-basal body complex protein [Clostridiales bacterium]
MIRGLYTSGWGMLVDSKRMDVIANNLANVNTNAYKKDAVVLEAFPDLLTKRINDTPSPLNPSGNIGSMELGSDVGQVFTYYTQGQLLKTDNKFDLALQNAGSAFFTVAVPDAQGNMQEYYTRDGAFVLNANKQLVTKEGYLVMGENGPITLQGENFSVQPDGTIVEDGVNVDKLLIRDFTDTGTLRKVGSNLVRSTEESKEQLFTGTVVQGFVEQANVNIVKEMVDMISVMRSYESNQKILQMQDSTLDKAVNEVGAVR